MPLYLVTDKRTSGYRLEDSIWRLKPVTNNPHSPTYGLYYIVKDVKSKGDDGSKAAQVALSLVDKVTGDDLDDPVPEEEEKENAVKVKCESFWKAVWYR